MEDPVALRERVQKKIVDIITSRLESGAMSEERAKEIARFVLDKLPENIDYPKLIEAIPRLDDNFQELSEAVVPIMKEYEFKVRETVNEQVSKLIQQGKLDEALKLTNRAIEYDKKLS